MIELNHRHARVIEMREVEKRTWRQTGAELGVGVVRARQIYLRAKHIQEILNDPQRVLDPFWVLETRAANILHNAGIETREAALKAYEAGELRSPYYKDYGWHGCRGLGKKTLKEIADWAGFELQQAPKKKVKFCPHCGRKLP